MTGDAPGQAPNTPTQDASMALDPEDLRTVMRHWPTGVTILATREGPIHHGLTVSSFTSVSLDPPLVIATIDANVRTHGMLERTGVFAVSFLSESQEHISNRFAGRDTEHTDRFDGLETLTAVTGSPILSDNMGWLDCVVVSTYPAGNQTIFIAEVVAASPGTSQVSSQTGDAGVRPLLYFNRAYRQMR
jgi:flavin reductase (DIM6/NTAB) family NADH-FMN oxidoreductase RutF